MEDKYKFKNNIGKVSIVVDPKGQGYLETYPPGEAGSEKYPRPKSLPMSEWGIGLSSPDVPAIDITADMFSHIDPTGKALGRGLAATLSDRQLQELASQYNDYSMTLRENSPNAEAIALTNGSDAILRTAVFGQGGPGAVRGLSEFKFNVEQKAILDKARNYAYTGDKELPVTLKDYIKGD